MCRLRAVEAPDFKSGECSPWKNGMTDPTITTLIAQLVGFFSPIIVDALKRDTWKPSQTLLLGAAVSIVIYVGLHGLLGTLTFPVTAEFLTGLVSVFGLQQAGYAVYFKDRNPAPVHTTETTIMPSASMVVTNTTTTEPKP